MSSKAEKLEAFGRLLDVMDRLRAECPWDKKQTFESLRHLTIEETYELGDAILSGNRSEIKKNCVIYFFTSSFILNWVVKKRLLMLLM